MELVPDWDDRSPWAQTVGLLTGQEILRGSDGAGFAVVLAHSDGRPSKEELKKLWKAKGRTGSTLVAVRYVKQDSDADLFAISGPEEDDAPVFDVEKSIVEQLLLDSLRTESPIRLRRDLRARIQTLLSGRSAGLRNEGLFASHVLDLQPSEIMDWNVLCEQGIKIRSLRGAQLLNGLGYKVESIGDGDVLLDRDGGHRRAAAVVLRGDESFENPLNRLNNATAVAHGLLIAQREKLPWLVVVGGSAIRLYPVDPDVGVGRKGQTQTYVELDLGILPEVLIGYLPLFFSSTSLTAQGAVEILLSQSSNFAAGLADRLRDRVYEGCIPKLAVAVAEQMQASNAKPDQQRQLLNESYHRAMIVLFRLLFVAYAEDRKLLPFEVSEKYTRNALKTHAKDLAANPNQEFDPNSTSLWDDLTQVWKVIDKGDVKGWQVPAYNGGLFSQNPDVNPSGAATYSLALTNNVIGPVLQDLLVDVTKDGIVGPVDFRSLSVREFGTIYEGLLESGLDVAQVDLTTDSADAYVPASDSDEVLVHRGDVYLHSLSGKRKATGSYFTRPFAVEHLLDAALEPAIARHLEEVKSLHSNEKYKMAAQKLFDFRVADLAMGSAHFLVAAIDRIEAQFSRFLAEFPMPDVAEELDRLRQAASSQLNMDPEELGIDDGMLLRRQIARRCIYGIDVNEIAVELARLAVWIHTFVPGLPLSFLNHGLVWGNSLTGVGTLEEIERALIEAERREHPKTSSAVSMFLPSALVEFLERSSQIMGNLAEISDVSVADVGRASELQKSLRDSLAPLADLCALITAERTTRTLPNKNDAKILLTANGSKLAMSADAESLSEAIFTHPFLKQARALAAEVQAAHLPVLFPEVFRRERPGFDVMLGNPPWEKLQIEEIDWWSLKFPELKSLARDDLDRAIADLARAHPELLEELANDLATVKFSAGIISAGPFPGIGAAHIDLYSAFCWRFWHLVRDQGRIGVVLPRTALSGAGTYEWREAVLQDGGFADITLLANTGKWAFDMEARYTIGLVTITKSKSEDGLRLRGPFASFAEYLAGMNNGQSEIGSVSVEELRSWSESLAIPAVPARELEVFALFRRHPGLGEDVGAWHFRPIQGDVNITKQKAMFASPTGTRPKSHTLPVWTGSSFNIWIPDTGSPYGYADPKVVTEFLQEKRKTQVGLKSSAFYGLQEDWATDPATLPMNLHRIAFRDVARSTDTRTMLCALIPKGVLLVHKAPYLFRQRGTISDEAYLLGVLSSIPFDWFARKFVELAMSFELLNTFPIPRIDVDSGLLICKGDPVWSGKDVRPLRDRVVSIAGLLTAVDDRFSDWAREIGVQYPAPAEENDREELMAELDAVVALLYGLEPHHLQQVFSTFHRGWKYERRLERVLDHYNRWLPEVS